MEILAKLVLMNWALFFVFRLFIKAWVTQSYAEGVFDDFPPEPDWPYLVTGGWMVMGVVSTVVLLGCYIWVY